MLSVLVSPAVKECCKELTSYSYQGRLLEAAGLHAWVASYILCEATREHFKVPIQFCSLHYSQQSQSDYNCAHNNYRSVVIQEWKRKTLAEYKAEEEVHVYNTW